jgi:hypothetical protein
MPLAQACCFNSLMLNPAGTLLAVSTGSDIDFYKFNGAGPMTPIGSPIPGTFGTLPTTPGPLRVCALANASLSPPKTGGRGFFADDGGFVDCTHSFTENDKETQGIDPKGFIKIQKRS